MCKYKKIGSNQPVPLYGHLTIEQIAMLGIGALGSKAVVNPLSTQLFKNQKKDVPKWFGVIVKGAIAFAAITQSDDENVNMLGWGAFASGALEAAEIVAPNIFGVQGIGSTTIDLNEHDWSYLSEPNSLSGNNDSYNAVGGSI